MLEPTIPQSTSLAAPTASPETDNFHRIAQREKRQKLEEALMLANLENEYLRIIPIVIKILKKQHKFDDKTKKSLELLFCTRFEGKTIRGFAAKHKICPETGCHWREHARKLIFELADEGHITISDELRKHLNEFYLKNNPTEEALSESDPTEVLLLKVRRSVVDSLARVGEPIGISASDKDIEIILEKVRRANLKIEDSNSLIAYAIVTTRNWAITMAKKKASTTRKEEKEKTDQIAEEQKRKEAAEEKINFESAKREMLEIMAKLAEGKASESSPNGKLSQIGLLYFSIFEKETEEQLEQRYPGTRRDAIYKRRERARDFVLKLASPNLQKFLTTFKRERKMA